MKNFFLNLSGLLYSLIAALHLIRFIQKWPAQIGSLVVPQNVSLWVCLVLLLLSMGCFVASAQKS